MRIKQDDLYARAWEFDHEGATFDAEYDNAAPPNSPKIAMQNDWPTEESCNTPGTSRERSPENSPQTDKLRDVKNT